MVSRNLNRGLTLGLSPCTWSSSSPFPLYYHAEHLLCGLLLSSHSHMSITLQPPSHEVCVHWYDTRCLSGLSYAYVFLALHHSNILVSVLRCRFHLSSSLSMARPMHY